MAQTPAERQRAYRARQRTTPPDLHCEYCGDLLDFEHTDKRFCSSACRSADWRRVSKVTVQHSDDGWPLRSNTYQSPDVERPDYEACGFIDAATGLVCHRFATWRVTKIPNRARGAPVGWYHCDEHHEIGENATCPIGIEHTHHSHRGCYQGEPAARLVPYNESEDQ